MTKVDKLLCGGLPYGVRFAIAGLWYLLSSPLSVSFVELIAWCSGVAWSWLLSVLVLRPLGRAFGTGLCQLLPCPVCHHLMGATKWSVIGSYLCWAWRHLGESANQVPGWGLLSKRCQTLWYHSLLVCCLWTFQRC